MADINTPDEGNENSKKNNNSSLKNKFVKDFAKKQLNSSDSNKFVDEVMSSDSLSGTNLEKEIIKYKSTVNEFSDFDEKSLNIYDLKRSVSVEYNSLSNTRNNYLEKSFVDYELDSKQRNKLESEIKNLSASDLNKLIGSEMNNFKFLEKTFGEGKINKLKNFKILESIGDVEINRRLLSLGESERKSTEYILTKFRHLKITDVDLKDLFTTSFFKVEEKREIISNFIPYISLKQALELGLYTNKEANEKKEALIKPLLKEKGLGGNNLSDAIEFTSLEDIEVKSSDFFDNDFNLSLISNGIGFSKFENNFNSFIGDVKNDLIENGPQTLDELNIALSDLGVNGVTELKKGGFLKISINGNDTSSEEYFKVTSFDDNSKKINLSLVGQNFGKDTKTIINTKGTETNEKDYHSIISLLKGKGDKNITFDILSSEEFDGLITDKNTFEVNKNEFDSITLDELERNPELAEDIVKNLEKQYNIDLDDLHDQLDSLEKEKKLLKTTNGTKLEIDILDDKIKLLCQLISDKKDDVNNVYTTSLEELTLSKRLSDLIQKIDSKDPSGKKFALSKGTIIESTEGEAKGSIYEIGGLDREKGEIVLNRKGEFGETLTENLSFEAFHNAFLLNGAKRLEKISTFEELLLKNEWANGFELDKGKLYEKSVKYTDDKGKTSTDNKEVEYFVSEKNELIKIENFDGSDVEVTFGKLETKTTKADEAKKKKETINNDIKISDKSRKISLNEFHKLISDEKYVPDWKIGKDLNSGIEKDFENDITPNSTTKFWNGKSITELYMGGKSLVDGITEYMGKGNDIKAAEFGMSLAKFLPKEIEEDYIAQTELKQNEAMEKELTALGKTGSHVATKRILEWLKNADTPEYKKEAGLMYMGKYGQLYAKELMPYEGKFLWYEAMGGRIGDKRFNDAKNDAIKGDYPFDEKELIIGLLGAQSKGYAKPNRRSKFNKEFKGKVNGGFEEEYKDGYDDATAKRKIGDIIDGGMGELTGNTNANALGWAKRAAEKGGDLEDMNELYFILLYSGSMYGARTEMMTEMQKHWLAGNSMIPAVFGSELKGQKIFNNTILTLSKQIEMTGKHSGIASEAQRLFDAALTPNKDYKKNVEDVQKFWKKYGKTLSRSLYITDDKNPEYAKTDKLVFFGKDGEHKEYYDYLKTQSGIDVALGKDALEDAVGENGATGMNNYQIIKKNFNLGQNMDFDPRNSAIVNNVWPGIWRDIISTKEKIKNDPGNEENYKKYLNDKLRQIVAGLTDGLGKDRMGALDTAGKVGPNLGSIGIKLSSFKNDLSEDILNGNTPNGIFEKAIENVVSGNISSTGLKDDLKKSQSFNIINETKGKVDNNFNYNGEEENVA